MNIYSTKHGWVTCAWVVVDEASVDRIYRKERITHETFQQAVDYIARTYRGMPWTTGF